MVVAWCGGGGCGGSHVVWDERSAGGEVIASEARGAAVRHPEPRGPVGVAPLHIATLPLQSPCL